MPIEEPSVLLEIKQTMELLSYFVPSLMFFYPIVCGFAATIYRCSGVDKTTSCSIKNFFGHLAKYTAIAYFSAFVFLTYYDTRISLVLKEDQLFYGFIAFVGITPMFIELVLSSQIFQRLFSLWVVKKLGLKENKKDTD